MPTSIAGARRRASERMGDATLATYDQQGRKRQVRLGGDESKQRGSRVEARGFVLGRIYRAGELRAAISRLR